MLKSFNFLRYIPRWDNDKKNIELLKKKPSSLSCSHVEPSVVRFGCSIFVVTIWEPCVIGIRIYFLLLTFCCMFNHLHIAQVMSLWVDLYVGLMFIVIWLQLNESGGRWWKEEITTNYDWIAWKLRANDVDHQHTILK